MIQSPYGCTVSVVQRLSATTFYPSWGTTMDKTLFVRRQRRGEKPKAQDATTKHARRHHVVKRVRRPCLTAQRRKSGLWAVLDDALPENPASAVLDDIPSSLGAVEEGLTAPRRRAPSPGMLDDGVSPKPPRGDAR